MVIPSTAINDFGSAPFPNWYAAMRYPNYVRGHTQKYSQIQLIAAFIKLVERAGIEKADAQAKKEVTELRNKALAIGEELRQRDVANGELHLQDQESFSASVDGSLDDAYNAMKAFVRVRGCQI